MHPAARAQGEHLYGDPVGAGMDQIGNFKACTAGRALRIGGACPVDIEHDRRRKIVKSNVDLLVRPCPGDGDGADIAADGIAVLRRVGRRNVRQ